MSSVLLTELGGELISNLSEPLVSPTVAPYDLAITSFVTQPHYLMHLENLSC